MNPIITGTTNVIAIGADKKSKLIEIYNTSVKKVETNNVALEQPFMPEQPNFQEPRTNADILSQNLEPSLVIEPGPVQVVATDTPMNTDVSDIIFKIAEIQGSLDELASLVLKKMPDKVVEEEKVVTPLVNTFEPNPVLDNNLTGNISNINTQAEISSFTPSTGNIFDNPQGPGLAV